MDASNRKQIRQAEKLAKVVEEKRRNFLIGAMSIPEGRAWFYDFLESCHLFSDPFTNEALVEAYRKGERNVGLKLFAEISQWAPDDYIKMIKEANHERSAAAEQPRSQDGDRGVEGPLDDNLDLFDVDDNLGAE